MRASLSWLRRLAELPDDGRLVADRLTMAGYVVASVEPHGEDTVLDVEVTYNRPDLLSHLGLARELAGVLAVPMRPLETAVPAHVQTRDVIDIAVEAADLCPVYTGRVVRGLRVGPSPAWLVKALDAAGQRSVNNVVDVTNYVMLEMGQPLHAFDLAKVRGPRIVVRRAPGEPFVAIDGRKLEIAQDDLAICDAERPAALAGVMGGIDSEVSGSTKDVLLESAVFKPLAIRATSRRHQLRSESSFRFERFVDPESVAHASDRAARLFVETCGATGVGPVVAAGPGVEMHEPEIPLRLQRVARVLGLAVAEREANAILITLGMRRVRTAGPGVAIWKAPSWRPDLVAEIDLIEEIGRRVGFDRIPWNTALATRPLTPDPRGRALRRQRDALFAVGMHECVNAPFVGEGPLDVAFLTDRPALRVTNPMRSEEGFLRRSLAGPLLASARRNRERGTASVRLFESAPVYVRGESDEATEEMLLVSGVLAGSYADAKGCVEAVLSVSGLAGTADFRCGAPRPLRSDRSATVLLSGETIGVVGELLPRAVESFGLAGPTAVFELRADRLAALARLDATCAPVSRFPATFRDLAWIVDEAVSWSAIEGTVRAAGRASGGETLQGVIFLNVFRGPQIGAGRKSVAFRMELRTMDRTLSGEDADAVVRDVVAALAKATGGALRA